MKIMKYLLPLCPLLFPAFASAAAGTDIFSFQQFIYDFLSSISVLFWFGAVAFFAFGVAKFLANADDSKEREEGKKFITWAIIAFVVLVSLWGFVSFFADTLGFNTGGTLDYIWD
jgi:putative copper export protein